MPRHGSLMEGPYPNDPNRISIMVSRGRSIEACGIHVAQRWFRLIIADKQQ